MNALCIATMSTMKAPLLTLILHQRKIAITIATQGTNALKKCLKPPFVQVDWPI